MTAGRLIATFATALVLVAGLGLRRSRRRCWRARRWPSRSSRSTSRRRRPRPTRLARAAGRRPVRRRPQVDPPGSTTIAERGRHPGARRPRLRQRPAVASPTGCKVGWTTLAGIGWVESQHGTIDGRTLGDDGHSSTPVLGPALDGKGSSPRSRRRPRARRGTATRTGTTRSARSSSSRPPGRPGRTDGDGDGVADPNDLDDAAFAAVALPLRRRPRPDHRRRAGPTRSSPTTTPRRTSTRSTPRPRRTPTAPADDVESGLSVTSIGSSGQLNRELWSAPARVRLK